MEPRALTEREKETLLRLLPLDGFPGVRDYRSQANHLEVTEECTCGCATINFRVDVGAAPPSDYPGVPLLPLEARAVDPTDPALPVEVILFAREGVLESLEIVYYGSAPPPEFPDPGELELWDRRTGSDAAQRQEQRR